jgi:hypothetical protein
MLINTRRHVSSQLLRKPKVWHAECTFGLGPGKCGIIFLATGVGFSTLDHPTLFFRGVLVEKRTGQSTPQELREIPRSTEFIDFLFEFFYQIAVPSALLFLVLRIVWPRVVKLVGLTDLDKILALVAGEPVERLNPTTD